MAENTQKTRWHGAGTKSDRTKGVTYPRAHKNRSAGLLTPGLVVQLGGLRPPQNPRSWSASGLGASMILKFNWLSDRCVYNIDFWRSEADWEWGVWQGAAPQLENENVISESRPLVDHKSRKKHEIPYTTHNS